jgi:hypothetical protein
MEGADILATLQPAHHNRKILAKAPPWKFSQALSEPKPREDRLRRAPIPIPYLIDQLFFRSQGQAHCAVYGGDVHPEHSLPRLPPFSHPQSYDSRHKHHQQRPTKEQPWLT